MGKIHRFNKPANLSIKKPINLSKGNLGNYYMNIYDGETGEFVESRLYEMYTITAMLDEAKQLRQSGYKVKW